ncbi:hypothetical protein HY382_01030 [Candidatus Curtissbacteria bacterium]|nr:hypothetical protein [Candidatus Curtissbacteria bacterium]
MTEAIAPSDIKVVFGQNISYLSQTGLFRLLAEASQQYEGQNDVHQWERHGGTFPLGVDTTVRIHMMKPIPVSGGRQTKHTHFDYDGSRLRVSGNSDTTFEFDLPTKPELSDVLKTEIQDALKTVFAHPEVTFLSTEELNSSD